MNNIEQLTELHKYPVSYRHSMKQIEFEDRATELSFRLHIKETFVVGNKEIHLSITPHYGIGKLFGLEEEYTYLDSDKGTYGHYVIQTDSYDELVKFIKETYDIDPIFPETFKTKIAIVEPEIEAARKRLKKRGLLK